VLVTGGAGFIGSHLAERLLSEEHNVTIVDNLSSGKIDNLKGLDTRSFKFVKADINDQEALLRALDGVDTVMHLAAVVSVHKSIVDPVFTSKVNVAGTMSLLECARKRGVRKFVFISSAAVYGDIKSLPIKEDSGLSPISPYGATKLEAEKRVLQFEREFGIDSTVLRLFNAYGPRSYGGEYSGVIAKFATRLSNYEGPIVYGDGLQTRDFVYVKDVVDAIIRASKPKPSRLHSVYNVGSGKPVTIEDLALLESELVLGNNVLIPFDYRPPVIGDIRHSYADITRIKSELGFEPRTSLEEGLGQYIEWLVPTLPTKQIERLPRQH
jgi:UDP-glucose 4-epimerase